MVTVDTKWLASHLDDPDIIILDTRGTMAYRFGHIKNSLPVDIGQVIFVADNGSNLVMKPQHAAKLFNDLGIDDSKKVVVYGEYPDPSAARVVWTLMYYGHANVNLLNVGYDQWQKKGFPIDRQVTHIKKVISTVKDSVDGEFIAKTNYSIRADARMIKEKQNDPNVIIIDARTPQEHLQARIPGSILNNWEDGLGDYGKMMKDKDKLKSDFDEKGIHSDKEIICYCHSGMRAAHKYLQFRYAGFDNVRLYDGSIIDWAQRRNPLR